MAIYYPEPSHTFSEYLLIPNLTGKGCVVGAVSLKAPLVRFARGEEPSIRLAIPLASAIMQSVSDHSMAIALARSGGISFIFVSQPIKSQAEMVERVKKFKAGFVVSDSNLRPDATLQDVLALRRRCQKMLRSGSQIFMTSLTQLRLLQTRTGLTAFAFT